MHKASTGMQKLDINKNLFINWLTFSKICLLTNLLCQVKKNTTDQKRCRRFPASSSKTGFYLTSNTGCSSQNLWFCGWSTWWNHWVLVGRHFQQTAPAQQSGEKYPGVHFNNVWYNYPPSWEPRCEHWDHSVTAFQSWLAQNSANLPKPPLLLPCNRGAAIAAKVLGSTILLSHWWRWIFKDFATGITCAARWNTLDKELFFYYFFLVAADCAAHTIWEWFLEQRRSASL